MKLKNITTCIDDDCGIGEVAFQVVVTMEFGQFTLDWIHMIYPGRPVLRMFLRAGPEKEVSMEAIGAAADRTYPEEWPGDFQDNLPLAPEHCRW